MDFSARQYEAVASSVPVFVPLNPASQCQAVHDDPSRDMTSGRWLSTWHISFRSLPSGSNDSARLAVCDIKPASWDVPLCLLGLIPVVTSILPVHSADHIPIIREIFHFLPDFSFYVHLIFSLILTF